ncbi:MAG: hypothetical protein ACRD1T_22580, partial [Acidimicrobiia bacterium]
LRSDLEQHPAFCTLAIWHEPLFSSGARSGGARYVRPFWDALHEHGADVIVNADHHNYERFAPQTSAGQLDTEFGIRQFVAGTGGNGLFRAEGDPVAHSEVIDDDTYGVLKLTLHPTGYDWEFLPAAGASFRDAGSGACHHAALR